MLFLFFFFKKKRLRSKSRGLQIGEIFGNLEYLTALLSHNSVLHNEIVDGNAVRFVAIAGIVDPIDVDDRKLL